jgi:hypothetical protein
MKRSVADVDPSESAFNAGYEALIAAFEAENPTSISPWKLSIMKLTFRRCRLPCCGEEADIVQLFGTWTANMRNGWPLFLRTCSLGEAQALYYAAPIGGYIVDGVCTVCRRSSTASTAVCW